MLKKEKNKKKHVIHKLLENRELHARVRNELEEELEEVLKEDEMNKKWETKKKLHLNQETPSRYLTSKLKAREKDRAIFQIKDKNGIIVSDKENIAKCFIDFYQDQYDEKPDNEAIHQELLNKWQVEKDYVKSLELDSEITAEEVAQAIKYSNPYKSPGLDGINAAFYRNHVELLSPILSKVFNDTLINQNGFVPSRYIQDNIQIMKEIIELAKKNRDDTTLITFFDFNKAFDSLSHESIRKTLNHIGIPIRMIELIMNLLKDTHNKINDFMVDKIIVKRGTKQGYPLSPTIFALTIDALLVDILNDRAIKGFSLPNNKNIKLTAFADDMPTFSKSVEER